MKLDGKTEKLSSLGPSAGSNGSLAGFAQPSQGSLSAFYLIPPLFAASKHQPLAQSTSIALTPFQNHTGLEKNGGQDKPTDKEPQLVSEGPADKRKDKKQKKEKKDKKAKKSKRRVAFPKFCTGSPATVIGFT